MAETRLWNSSTQPLVPAEIGWGGGVVMPGESFLTDHPETYGPPWTTDPDADARLEASRQELQEAVHDLVNAETAVTSAETADAVSEPPVASDGQPELHVTPNGDVLNESGHVVGHIDA